MKCGPPGESIALNFAALGDALHLRHAGYAVSQRIRKRIEEVFGWIKKPGGLVKAKVRGRPKVEAVFTFAVVAYNLVRLPKLIGPEPA